MKKVKLTVENHASFHFGDAAGNLKTQFSSDQLVSALVNNVVLLYGSNMADPFIEKMKQGEIKFSSLYVGLDFICKNDHSVKLSIPFLPRPKVDLINLGDPASFKKMKKISFVSNRLYHFLSDRFNQKEQIIEIDDPDSFLLIGSAFAILRDELSELEISQEELENLSIIQIHTKPGVEVGRYDQRSENYFTKEDLVIHFGKTKNYEVQPFMYFYVKGELSKYMQAAIHLLGDEGIGGRRSLGRGFFHKVEFVQEMDSLPSQGSFYMNLSTYFPKQEELSSLYSYELEKRNGYVYSLGGKTVRKKSVMTIQEGSLFTRKVNGDMVDIKPKNFSHPVYLNGQPLLIGFGGEDG